MSSRPYVPRQQPRRPPSNNDAVSRRACRGARPSVRSRVSPSRPRAGTTGRVHRGAPASRRGERLCGLVPCRRAARARASDALHALDELRCDRDRDGDRHAELVERGREGPQRALGIRERVGRPDAAQQCCEAEPVVGRREHALRRHGAADLHARHEAGKWEVRNGQEHVFAGAGVATEQDAEPDPDGDHDDAEQEIQLVGARPRRFRPARGDDGAGHREHQREEQRIGRAAGRGPQPDRPDPPRDRMHGAREAQRRDRGDAGRSHRARVMPHAAGEL